MRISEKPMKNETNAANTFIKTYVSMIHEYMERKELSGDTSEGIDGNNILERSENN